MRLRGAVVDQHRPQSTEPRRRTWSRTAFDGLCVTAQVCTRQWIFRRRPAIPTDLFTVQVVVAFRPGERVPKPLQYDLRLTVGSGLMTAMPIATRRSGMFVVFGSIC